MTNTILKAETAGELHGVPGRFFNVIGEAGGRIRNQKFATYARPAVGYGEGATISAHVRFDDECGNGRESFAITGEVKGPRGRWLAGGCLHEDIAAAFPELAPLIRWHLTAADGPMHYVANTLYHAGNRDHNGKVEGEPFRFQTVIQFGANPIKHKFRGRFVAFLQAAAAHPGRQRFDFEVIRVDHKERETFGPKWTFGGYGEAWHDCPFNTEGEALDFLAALQTAAPAFVQIPTDWGKGKARDFDAARSCAVWPDATEADLSADPADLKAALLARLPALLADFERDVTAAGLMWSAPALAPAEA